MPFKDQTSLSESTLPHRNKKVSQSASRGALNTTVPSLAGFGIFSPKSKTQLQWIGSFGAGGIIMLFKRTLGNKHQKLAQVLTFPQSFKDE